MTCAPRSASRRVQYGPASTRVKSITVTPSRSGVVIARQSLSSYRLGARLQRDIHCLEALLRRGLERAAEQRHQHTGERLGMQEPDARPLWLETEDMLAVGHARH